MITNISSNWPSIHPVTLFPQAARVITEINEKIAKFVLPYFSAGCSFFLFSQGVLELFYSQKAQSSREYLQAHGGLLVGSGFCTGVTYLHTKSIVNLGILLPIIQTVGSVLFLYAHLVALDENMTTLERLRNTSICNNPQKEHLLNLQKRSAIFGILSNLGYIAATALALFGATATGALVIGIIAACFGGLKMLHDLLASLPM